MEIEVAEEFKRRYEELPGKIKIKAEKQEKLFRANPFYPSLHTEKINPKDREVWTIRIDDNYRIAFRFLTGKKVLFLTVGPHDWIYRIKF